MTKRQLLSVYWESFRQEARQNLLQIKILGISRMESENKQEIEELERLAYPFDPEADGDFDREDITIFKRKLGVFL
jgi:hypothetical protein